MYCTAGEKVLQSKLCTQLLPEGNDCSQSMGYAGDMAGGTQELCFLQMGYALFPSAEKTNRLEKTGLESRLYLDRLGCGSSEVW